MEDFLYLFVTEARDDVIIHHPHSLHEGITDHGADKGEAPFLEFPAHHVGFPGAAGNLLQALPAVLNGGAFYKAPQERIKRTIFFLDLDRAASILNGGLDLPPVSDDTGVAGGAPSPFRNRIAPPAPDGTRQMPFESFRASLR